MKAYFATLIATLTESILYKYADRSEFNLYADEVSPYEFAVVTHVLKQFNAENYARVGLRKTYTVTIEVLQQVADHADTAENNATIMADCEDIADKIMQKINSDSTVINSNFGGLAIEERQYDAGMIGWSITFDIAFYTGLGCL